MQKLPDSNTETIVISGVCVIYLVYIKEFINPLIKKKINVQFPSELLLVSIILNICNFSNDAIFLKYFWIQVVLATSISAIGEFNKRFEIAVVGHVPTG